MCVCGGEEGGRMIASGRLTCEVSRSIGRGNPQGCAAIPRAPRVTARAVPAWLAARACDTARAQRKR